MAFRQMQRLLKQSQLRQDNGIYDVADADMKLTLTSQIRRPYQRKIKSDQRL
jgi:uncharacterized protein YqiB (DUF1249 family)